MSAQGFCCHYKLVQLDDFFYELFQCTDLLLHSQNWG